MSMDEFMDKGGQEWFISEISDKLGIKSDNIQILEIREGSVIVVFEL
jgi:hypothetical protein